MRRIIGFCVMFVCCVTRSVTASYCYPDYCQNLTILVPTVGFQCVLTQVQRGDDCAKFKFPSPDRKQPEEDTTKFILQAYVKDFKEFQKKATAFNLSVTHANFLRLTTRYQSLIDDSLSACRHIHLYPNGTHPAPTELYVSCPFSNDSYESSPYRLEYLVTGETYTYSKQYIFNVPVHKYMEADNNVKQYTPFIYVDVSDAPILSLHVQPVPERYNVTKYKIWLINNDTDSATYADTLVIANKQHILYNFTAHNGVYYFRVCAVHQECGEYGCANSTTPFIIIKEASHRLLIMIISTVWILPVVLCTLYHAYKLYKKEALKRRKKPNCLLVYSPSRLSHVNVMIDLAKYLRDCDVNAMIDMLDVALTTDKDPDLWCNTAFHSADVVLVATSPPPKESPVSVTYQNVDEHFLRLFKESYSRREKRYYIVQFPYCKPDDVPEDTRHFKRFSLPKELPKLVKTIHDAEHVRFASDLPLLDSIKLAKLEILEEDGSFVKDTEETGLLQSRGAQKPSNNQVSVSDTPEGNAIPQSFATNIDELNLLGESDGGFIYKPSTTSDTVFRIDELKL